MTANVPTIDIGSARLGMVVAETFRRNRKITRMTRNRVRTRVNLTSPIDAWIDSDRSYRTCIETEAGSSRRKAGRRLRTAVATSTVFAPGWRYTAREIERCSVCLSMYQAAVLSFSTPSITFPIS